MPGNILQSIGLTPEWFSSVMGGVAHGVDQPEPEAPMQQPAGQPTNLLQGLDYAPAAPGAAEPQIPQQPQPAAPAPRQRRSLLSTVGGIADVLAKVGGAEALYQPSLDAREDRGFAIEDRQRGIDLDALKTSVARAQLQGEQYKNENTLQERMGQAFAAIADQPELAQQWPQIAEQIGLPPDKAAQVGALIQANPARAGALAKLFGGAPKNQQAASLKVVDAGDKQFLVDPLTGQTIREIPVTGLSPREAAQTRKEDVQSSIALGQLTLAQQREAREAAKAEAKAAGQVDLTPTQRGVVTQKLQIAPILLTQLARVEKLNDEMKKSNARGFFGGRVPGALAGAVGAGIADQYDSAVEQLAKQVTALTRIPGVGTTSDYDRRLDQITMPSRERSDEGRAESLTGIRTLVEGMVNGYKEILGPERPAAPARGGGNRPPMPPRLGGQGKPAASGARMTSIAEAMKLPPGTVFIDPNGVRRVR